MDRETRERAPRYALVVRDMMPADWPEVRDIYEQGIATGDATFETRAPTRLVWDAAHLAAPRLVAGADGGGMRLLGWAALTPVSSRAVYGGVADVSIYVAGGARHRRVGRALLKAMIERSEADGIWTLQAGVFPENRASLALHLAGGFRVVGRRERIGHMGDRWRDVVLLERRSPTIG